MVRGTLGAIAIAVSTGVFGQVTGTGEYRFGPETAQNIACQLAEEKAKENAIANYVGEYIEHQTNQVCKDEHCTDYRSYFSETSGRIQTILDRTVLVAPERGQSVCIVDITAKVEKISNTITFKMEGQNEFKHGDRFVLSGISNRVGNFHVFNVSDDKFRLIYSGTIPQIDKEFQIPKANKKMEARIPYGKHASKELLTVVFSGNDLTPRQTYSRMEFNEMVKSIPFIDRKVINFPINIVR
jgi:hypothetical protein